MDECLNEKKDFVKEFDGLREHAIPFFRRHIGEVYSFFKDRRHYSANLSTIELLQMFLRDRKMPFDMRQYMQAQSEFIKAHLDGNLPAEERQKAVSAWIKRYAEEHRDHAIEVQCQFIEIESSWIVPEIDKMLVDFEKANSGD